MARNRRNNHGVPRAKRMKRSARLRSAVSWLEQFKGNNVVRSFCKRYGVDWRSAVIELKHLGIQLDPEYLNRRVQSEGQVVNERRRRRKARASELSVRDPIEYESIFDAYLAKDFTALHTMECQRDGIDRDTG